MNVTDNSFILWSNSQVLVNKLIQLDLDITHMLPRQLFKCVRFYIWKMKGLLICHMSRQCFLSDDRTIFSRCFCDLWFRIYNRDETISVCSKLLTILLKEIKLEFYIKIKMNARTKEMHSYLFMCTFIYTSITIQQYLHVYLFKYILF